MNKQEAIEKATERMKQLHMGGTIWVNKDDVIDIISKIDEPQKPVMPKFVADFYESIKYNFESNVYSLCLQYNRGDGELSSEFKEWFNWGKNEPIQTLVKMKLYGYEIEQEKLYTVEIPDPHGLYKIRYLFRDGRGNIRIRGTDYRDIFSTTETHLTESEIKKDFEWAWDAGFAKEVE